MTGHSKNMEATRYLFSVAYSKQHSKEELDSIFIVSGEEGSGKSTFILKGSEILEEISGEQISIEYITRNLKEMIKYLKVTPKKGFIALDEGVELSSDNQWDPMVRATKRAFTIMRQKALICLIAFVNPFRLYTYFREDRLKGLFFITKRKYIYYFTRTKFQDIMRTMKKEGRGVKSVGDFIKLYGNKATFTDTFTDYNGHLLKEYKKRKDENIDEVLEDLYFDFGVEEKLYTFRKACKYLDIRPGLLNQYILKEGEQPDPNKEYLPVKWNLTKTNMRITEKDMEDWKEWFVKEERDKIIQSKGAKEKKEVENKEKQPNEPSEAE